MKPASHDHAGRTNVIDAYCLPAPFELRHVSMATFETIRPVENHNWLLYMLYFLTSFLSSSTGKDSNSFETLPIFVYVLKIIY